MLLSRWNKLIDEILKLNKNLRFEDLSKALKKAGYTQKQPKGGSSHYNDIGEKPQSGFCSRKMRELLK
jgi:hypothetical protein